MFPWHRNMTAVCLLPLVQSLMKHNRVIGVLAWRYSSTARLIDIMRYLCRRPILQALSQVWYVLTLSELALIVCQAEDP